MALRQLDTNIISFEMNAHTLAAVYQPHLVGYTHAASFQTVAELYEGAALAGWGPVKRARLDMVVRKLVVLGADDIVCRWWAEVRAVRRTRPIGVADAWVAATALAYNLELVTHNPADFAGIPGLIVITEAP